jgi:MFS family permease
MFIDSNLSGRPHSLYFHHMADKVHSKPSHLAQAGKKTVRTLAAAAFLNDLGSDMIYPIWPLFVTSVLGANLTVLGLIDGIGDAVVSLSSAASGYVSDKTQRRKVFIWVGYLLASLSRVGYAGAMIWQHLVPLRVLDRVGKIRSAPRDAIIADVSADEERGRNFGFVRAMDNLGAVVGIVACILLFNIGYRNLFLVAAVPSVLSAALVFGLVRDPARRPTKMLKGLSFRHIDRNLRLFVILSALFALGSFSYSFLLLYGRNAGVSDSTIPVLYLVFTAVAALVSMPFGRLSDRIGRKPVMLFSCILWGLVCASFLWVDSPPLVFLVFLVYGLHRASIDTVQRVFVAELAPPQYRASTLGGFQLVIGLCALPASLVAGILWDAVGREAPLLLSIGLTVASVSMLVFVHEPVRASSSTKPQSA